MFYCLKNTSCGCGSQWETDTCIPLFSLLPAVREEQHLTREHILLGDSVDVQSVYSGLPSTRSFWLYYSLLSKTQGMNKCIIGVICLGGWVKRSVYSWLHHSVSAPVSDRRSSTSCKEKTECWHNPIWFTYGRHAAITISWQLLSVEYVADWQQLRKKHSGSGQDAFVSVTVSVRPLKCNQGQDVCFQDTQASMFDLKSAVTANDFRSRHTVKDKS